MPLLKPINPLPSWNTHTFTPHIQIHLPRELYPQAFWSLLPGPSSEKQPSYRFPALQNWLAKLLDNLALQEHEAHPFHEHPFKLLELRIENVGFFDKDRIGFMKIRARIETDAYVHGGEMEPRKDWLPGNIFLRGSSVAVLLIIQPDDADGDDEKFVVFTVQPRVAASSLAFVEIPAGMVQEGVIEGVAAKELREEVGIEVRVGELVDMSALVLERRQVVDVGNVVLGEGIAGEDAVVQDTSTTTTTSCPEDILCQAMYPSPSACDESIPLMLCQKRLPRAQMLELIGKATGLRDQGEFITLKLVPLHDAWREGARDAKTLAALALYEGLKKEGRLPDMPAVEETGDMEADMNGEAHREGTKEKRKRKRAEKRIKGKRKAEDADLVIDSVEEVQKNECTKGKRKADDADLVIRSVEKVQKREDPDDFHGLEGIQDWVLERADEDAEKWQDPMQEFLNFGNDLFELGTGSVVEPPGEEILRSPEEDMGT